MNKIKFLSQIGLLLTASVSMATQVNVNHLASFANTFEETVVSVNVNEQEAIPEIKYLESSGYIEIAGPGVEPGITLLEVFDPGLDTPIMFGNINLAADTFYSVTAIGDGINQPLALLPLEDDNTAPAEGNAKLRIIHAASFAVNIEDTAVSVRTDEGDIVNELSEVPFGDNSGFFEVPAGVYDLNISTPDGSTRLIDIEPLDLAAGTIVNVFAVGDGMNQPLGIYAVFGDGTSVSIGLETTITPEPTRVNVAHLAPFAPVLSDTAVSVDVNGNEVITNVLFKQTSGYLTIADDGTAPGLTNLDVFTPPGSETPAISAEVDLDAQTDYTVAAVGDGANLPLILLPLIDDNSAPADGNFKLRIVHAAPFADNLPDTAVSIRTDEGDLVAGLTGVEFGVASDYLELPAGTYDLNVSTPDGSTRLIDLAPVTLGSGDVVTVFAIGDGVNQDLGFFALFGDGSSAILPTEPPFTTLTPGFNGSWWNPENDGQGFTFEVYPELGSLFVTWYTFDTTFADGNETAVVGEPNQRWLTAQGDFNGTSADLTIYLTEGGIFNTDNAVTRTEAGTMTVDFNDCRTAQVEFSLTDSGLTGMIPVERISGSIVPFCESTLNALVTQ